MRLSLDQARALEGTEEPRGKGQVVVAARAAGRQIEVKIGRYLTRGKREYRVTRLHDRKEPFSTMVWPVALMTARESVEHQLKHLPGETYAVTLRGDEAVTYGEFQKFAAECSTDLPGLLKIFRQFSQPS